MLKTACTIKNNNSTTTEEYVSILVGCVSFEMAFCQVRKLNVVKSNMRIPIKEKRNVSKEVIVEIMPMNSGEATKTPRRKTKGEHSTARRAPLTNRELRNAVEYVRARKG